MTMNFQIIRDSLISLLGAAESGEYRTVGYQQQGQSAIEVLDTDRSVQVFYSSGVFPKSAGSISGPVMHDITFIIQLTVSKATEGDLAVLENPASTAGERATALAAFQDSSYLADRSLDELVEIIYQIIMDAENIDLGLDQPVANRWVNQVQKDNPLPRGQYVVLTGSMQLTCSIDEQVTGDSGTTAGEIMDTEIELETDETGKAGTRTGG